MTSPPDLELGSKILHACVSGRVGGADHGMCCDKGTYGDCIGITDPLNTNKAWGSAVQKAGLAGLEGRNHKTALAVATALGRIFLGR